MYAQAKYIGYGADATDTITLDETEVQINTTVNAYTSAADSLGVGMGTTAYLVEGITANIEVSQLTTLRVDHLIDLCLQLMLLLGLTLQPQQEQLVRRNYSYQVQCLMLKNKLKLLYHRFG